MSIHKYQQAFDQLNPQQKDAVTSIEGPVMVIAGPGTGKTQVIASRIAFILENTDTNPQNILCLTYTEAGSVAMKNRLIEFIGPTGHDVRISTFHGFCNEVIQENSDYFGQKEMEPMDDLERVRILKQIIDSFDKDNPLKRYKYGTYYDLNNLKNLFSTMRKEDLSYITIKEKIEQHLEFLKTDESMLYKRNTKDGKKGDLNLKKYNDLVEKFTKTIFASAEFENYLNITRENGQYDFDDMILWVRNAFQKNDFILKRYQEKYQYILVDEYQDTNGSQNEVVELLADYFENPNLFVVGDDDQSIYRFQGANMDNILDFRKKYDQHLKTIPMVINYRSSQKILDASMHLINNNQSRILSGEQKQLTAGNPERSALANLPNVLEFKNVFQENAFICDYILKEHHSGNALSDIAIIYRSHADAEPIIDYLQKKNVPVNAVKSVNILNEPLVKNFLSLLRYFQSELEHPYSNKTELYQVMTLPWFNFDHMTVANFSFWSRLELNKWIYKNDVPDKNRRVHWRYLLNHVASANEILSEQEITLLSALNKTLESLLSASNEYTLSQYFGLIMEECGVLDWIMNSKEKIWNLEVYRAFFDFIKAETTKNPGISFNHLFQTLNTMIDEGLSIELAKTLIDKKGVQFLTAHRSKGLEFKTVFIINCTDKSWNKKDVQRGFHFPPNLFHTEQNQELISEEESRRLFYVAMTRAESNLYATFSLENEKERPQLPSKFIDEILQGGEFVSKQLPEVPKDVELDFVSTIQSFKLATPGIVNEDWLTDLLQDYRLSVTDMNTFLKCPVTFYYEKVLKIPSAKTESLALGSAAHEALEYFIKDSKDQRRMLEKEEFMLLFKIALDKQKGILTSIRYQNDLEYGHKFLSAYYDLKMIHYDLANTTQEIHVKARVEEQVLLKGMLDRIEEQKNNLLVYDYKTGKHKPENFKRPGDEKTTNENIHKYGGEYWRQSVFYSILLENSERHFNYDVSRVTFEFLESAADHYKEEVIEISPGDKTFMIQLASEVYRKIKNLEFTVGCNEENCKWCNLQSG